VPWIVFCTDGIFKIRESDQINSYGSDLSIIGRSKALITPSSLFIMRLSEPQQPISPLFVACRLLYAVLYESCPNALIVSSWSSHVHVPTLKLPRSLLDFPSANDHTKINPRPYCTSLPKMCHQDTTKYTNCAFVRVYSSPCYDPIKNPEYAEFRRDNGPCPKLQPVTMIDHNDHCNCKVTNEPCCMELEPYMRDRGGRTWSCRYEPEDFDKGKEKEGEKMEVTSR
jgi:hypothetical protein